MQKEHCFYLGKIVKKHGLKGELVVKLDTDDPELYKNLESVFVELNNNLIPFFIEKSSLSKGIMLRLKFENIKNQEDVQSIIGASLYLPLDSLPELTGNKFYYHQVIGFTIYDKIFGLVGRVKKIDDTSAQALFVVEAKGKEVLIPVTDHFIKNIDRERQIIEVSTPEGLIDLYLS
ncbi:MAG: ribosome maturation factor RimM [Tenacibaculum sp.]